MPSTVEELSANRAKLTIEIPFTELKPHLDKAYREIAQQINVPGFRKGKVPAALIDQRVGRGTVLQEAINDVLPQAYGEALAEHKIIPLGDPQIEMTELEDGQKVVFTAEVDKRPEFDLPDFASIKVTAEAVKEGDAGVDERIDMLRQRFATYSDVDRAAAEGDVVVADLAGSRDGEPLADATAEGVQFKIGQGAMLEGLDAAVTGLKAGESAEFSSTLVGGPLKGQDADIKVTVQKVQEQKLPELDDEFAQMVSEFDTVDEMKADLAEGVQRQAKIDQAVEARDAVLKAAVEATNMDLPERVIQAEKDARRENINQQLQQAGYTLEQYLAEVEEGKAADQFWNELDENTELGLRAQLMLDKIADEREIGLGQDDLTQYLFARAAQNGTSPDQEAQHMLEHNHVNEWMQEIRRNKALQLILDEATAEDESGNKVDFDLLKPPALPQMTEAPEGGVEPVSADADDADEAQAEALEADAQQAQAKAAEGDAETDAK